MIWSAPVGQRAGRPLLLALHGHNGDEQQLAVSSVLLPRELVVVTPRAPYREPGGWSWFELAESGRDAAAHVTTQLMRWLDRQTGYSSIGLLGLSQGAAMAISVLRRDPARFAYLVQLSGFAIDTSPDPELARLKPPAFSAHGGQDRVIPADRAEDTARWLREHTTLTEKRYPQLGHSVAPAEILDVSRFIADQLKH